MFLDIDIEDKRFVVLGLQGTGKSYLVKGILKNTPSSIVYDVMREHTGLNRYIVDHRENSREGIAELNHFVNQVVIASGQIRLFVLEEANRYCPPKPAPLPQSILDLNDLQRHFKITFGSVARRPVQLHTDLVELAHYLFIFRLVGINDLKYLEAVAEGLGEAVRRLKDYHFILVNPDRTYQEHKPIKI
jgi:hypothetical protein